MTKLIKITGFVIGLALGYSSLAIANEIYIEQIGDNLDLDITQDGQNNEFGDSTTDALLDGDDMTFAITQTGNTNTIDAKISLVYILDIILDVITESTLKVLLSFKNEITIELAVV